MACHLAAAACALALSGGAVPTSAATASTSYRDPTTGNPAVARVLRPFEKPERNWHSGHRGVDLALGVGQPVLAAGPGTVVFSGTVAGRPSVAVEHPDGLRSTYTPVFGRKTVGERVGAGEPIGTLAPPFDGHPGLHWGVLRGKDDYLNPLSLLAAPVIRLKPVR
ncbi:murein hydrolase activator EnvC family protein [Corynebacterium phocae]|nr:M23 family metallopeptidase [Corynebacterium phocae]